MTPGVGFYISPRAHGGLCARTRPRSPRSFRRMSPPSSPGQVLPIPALFVGGLLVVVILAQALVIGRISEELPVATMRTDVVHHRCRCPDPLRSADAAEGFRQEMISAQPLPRRCAVECVVLCARAAFVFGLMPRAPAFSCQLAAPCVPAGPERFESHRLSPRRNHPSRRAKENPRPVKLRFAIKPGAGCQSTGRCR